MPDPFRAKLGQILGFYDFGEFATVVSPFHTATITPGAVELHEMVHRDLADCSSTGIVCRLIMSVLSECSDHLPSDLTDLLYGALDSMLLNIREVHESAATFLSILMLEQTGNRSIVEEAISGLNEFYMTAMLRLKARLP